MSINQLLKIIFKKVSNMKRVLLITLFIICNFNAFATHLMGGEIVAKYDSTSGKYVLILTHYRDTLGVPMYANTTFNIYKDSLGTYTLLASNSVPLNTTLSQLLLPNFPYGVEVGVYTDSVSLLPGTYHITNETCCRNGAIINMSSPMSESMILYTDLLVDSVHNSTPDFMAMPVAHFPINQPATYNPLPYDPDGDSIAWGLNMPIGGVIAGSGALVPVNGFVAPAADPNGPFTINPVTGEITWTPDTLGNFVQSFEVTEFKNGIPSGKIIRDMQYVIVPSNGNSSPMYQSVTPYQTNTAEHYYYYYYTPGQQMIFSIKGSDADINTNLTFQAFSPIFSLPNPASFITTGTGMNKIGTLTWTPPAGYSRDEICVFRIGDGQVMKDFTLLLKRKTTSIELFENIISGLTIYPNPTKNKLSLNIELSKAINTSIAMYSVLGQKVNTIYDGKLMNGKNIIEKEINVANGVYYLLVKVKGAIIKTEKIVIE